VVGLKCFWCAGSKLESRAKIVVTRVRLSPTPLSCRSGFRKLISFRFTRLDVKPRFFALFFSALTAASIGAACSCIPAPPVSVALAKSDFVLYGRCISFSMASEMTRTARFEIVRLFKGKIEATAVNILTSMSGGSCGFNFVAGDYYLVYGYAEGDGLRTSICTRTKELYRAQADEDNEYVALGMMIGVPQEKWKDFDTVSDSQDPFIRRSSGDLNTGGPDRFLRKG